MDYIGPVIGAGVFVLIMSLVREPSRRTVNAVLVAGASGAIGRRLDFLAQELNREANTLCSKSNDVELTNIGLELRSVVEQFREQVQNLE